MVFELIDVTAAETWEFTLALTFVASDVEAARTVELVFALTKVTTDVEAVAMVEARDVEALRTSDCSASDPEEREPAVRVREPNDQMDEAVSPVLPLLASVKPAPVVPGVVTEEVATFQTSAARVPNVVSDLVPFAQTAVGMVENSEVEAVRS